MLYAQAVILLKNVAKHGTAVAIGGELRRLHYMTRFFFVNSSAFGLPQSRIYRGLELLCDWGSGREYVYVWRLQRSLVPENEDHGLDVASVYEKWKRHEGAWYYDLWVQRRGSFVKSHFWVGSPLVQSTLVTVDKEWQMVCHKPSRNEAITGSSSTILQGDWIHKMVNHM